MQYISDRPRLVTTKFIYLLSCTKCMPEFPHVFIWLLTLSFIVEHFREKNSQINLLPILFWGNNKGDKEAATG